MRRVKVPKRAVQPNQGVVRAFAKQIDAMLKAANKDFIKHCLEQYEQITANLVQAKDAAMDASSSIMTRQMSLATAKSIAEAQLYEDDTPDVRKISYTFVRNLLRHLSASQRRALEGAGVSKALLKERFSVPVIRGQYIAPSTAEKIPDYVEWSTKLIARLRTRSRLRIQELLADALEHGKPLSQLQSDIQKAGHMDSERAFGVALDQSCKLNNFIQIENCKALGITEGIWVHVPGMYTSRKSHIKMDGQRFDIIMGMYDPEVGAYIQPGELPFCHCIYRPVLPDSIMET